MKRLKVLFHVNDPERWQRVLGNITNLLRDVGQGNVDVEIVANGPSVSAYVDSQMLGEMKRLAEMGVRFTACRNSIKKLCEDKTLCINEDAMPSFIEVIPAGITEIIERQAEGYAYVKP